MYYWSVFLWLFWNAMWQFGELVPSDVLQDHTYYWPMGSHPNSFYNFRWWASWGLLGALVPITVTEVHHILWRHNWRTQKPPTKKTAAAPGKVVLIKGDEQSGQSKDESEVSKDKCGQNGYTDFMIQRDF
eukprot:3798524-Pyramimonas_sp.AAC.1